MESELTLYIYRQISELKKWNKCISKVSTVPGDPIIRINHIYIKYEIFHQVNCKAA